MSNKDRQRGTMKQLNRKVKAKGYSSKKKALHFLDSREFSRVLEIASERAQKLIEEERREQDVARFRSTRFGSLPIRSPVAV